MKKKEGMNMGFSEFLASRREAAGALVQELRRDYGYVSILGEDIKETGIHADRNTSGIRAGGNTGCGFVVKLSKGSVFFEYSLDDISGPTMFNLARMSNGIATVADTYNIVINYVFENNERNSFGS